MTSQGSTPDALRQRIEQAADQLKRERLRAMKAIALGLFGAATALYITAQVVIGAHPAWPTFWTYVSAFAEAAMIGAVADWFAVVALFRHPLGIPVWHTAIIPRSKADIARNLGEFVVTHFLNAESIVARVRTYDPAARLGQWLLQTDSGERIATLLATALASILRAADDARMRQIIRDAAVKRLGHIDLSGNAGAIVAALIESRKHQQLLDDIIAGALNWLVQPDSPKQLGKILADALELPDFLRGLVDAGSGQIVSRLGKTLTQVRDDPDHAWRGHVDRYVGDFAMRLKADPEWREQIDAARDRLLADPLILDYINGIWDEVKDAIDHDLRQPDSTLHGHVRDAVASFGQRLGSDADTRAWINDRLLAAIPPLVEQHRDSVADFVRHEIDAWSGDEMSTRIELAIGRDLQFIRINGTLVGGMVGVVIHLVTELVRH